MTIYTTGYSVEWKPAGSWVDITSSVLSISGDFQTTGTRSGVAFGDSSTAQASLRLKPGLSLASWELVPVRATFTRNAVSARGLAGVITAFEQTTEDLTLRTEGYQRLIAKTKIYSPIFRRRPIATKTTASSVEDPAGVGYAAGPINYGLWQAGGRPYEQAGSYPAALFYYSCHQGLIAPDYSWLAGEDTWETCLRLCRAAGGQLYQRPDGVVAYASPLSLAEGSSVFSLGPSDYGSARRSGDAGATMASAICPYQARYISSLQEIISDATARVVGVGKTVTIDLEPKYPIAQLETLNGAGAQLVAGAISATYYDGSIPASGVGYTHTLSVAAQRVTIAIANIGAQPFVVEKIVIRAKAIAPGEAGTFVVGSALPTLTLEQNEFVQSRAHARRLTKMAMDLFGQARPIITVDGCVHNPALQIGSIGTFTCAKWGMTSTPVCILSVSHSRTGRETSYELLDITGLPKLSDYFLVSTSSQAGQTKRIGY